MTTAEKFIKLYTEDCLERSETANEVLSSGTTAYMDRNSLFMNRFYYYIGYEMPRKSYKDNECVLAAYYAEVMGIIFEYMDTYDTYGFNWKDVKKAFNSVAKFANRTFTVKSHVLKCREVALKSGSRKLLMSFSIGGEVDAISVSSVKGVLSNLVLFASSILWANTAGHFDEEYVAFMSRFLYGVVSEVM